MVWITFFKLMIAHAVTDFALQPPNIAISKNRHAGPPPGYMPDAHGPIQPVWLMVMPAHALISAGGVWIVTGSPEIAFFEFLLHLVLDIGKCEQVYNVWVDQAMHVLTKVLFALALTTDLEVTLWLLLPLVLLALVAVQQLMQRTKGS